MFLLLILSPFQSRPPVYIFVLDVAQDERALGYMKESMLQALELMPENSHVGMVSFGSMVYVHELGCTDFPKAYLLRGDRETAAQDLQTQLGLGLAAMKKCVACRMRYFRIESILLQRGMICSLSCLLGLFSFVLHERSRHQCFCILFSLIPLPHTPPLLFPTHRGVGNQHASGFGRFLVHARDAAFLLEAALEDLRPDPFPVAKGKRRRRCTGAALGVAARLLEACVPNMGARMMLFTGGPTTIGPGIAVSEDLAEPIRTHQDLEKGLAAHWKKSCGCVLFAFIWDSNCVLLKDEWREASERGLLRDGKRERGTRERDGGLPPPFLQ